MNDLMLYVMVASIFGLFGWAGYEYAKAGYQFWKEQHGAANAVKAEKIDPTVGVSDSAGGLPSDSRAVNAADDRRDPTSVLAGNETEKVVNG